MSQAQSPRVSTGFRIVRQKGTSSRRYSRPRADYDGAGMSKSCEQELCMIRVRGVGVTGGGRERGMQNAGKKLL